MKRIVAIPISLLLFFVCLAGNANAIPLTMTVLDPVGDQFGPSPDLIRMDFNFDNDSGDYTIFLHTTVANPFISDFRININLFNPDTGTTAPDPSFFNDNLNDFNLATPTTTLNLSGTNSRLLSWDAGDTVYINNWDTPSPGNPRPDGTTFFRSGVIDIPLPDDAFVNEDYFNQVTASIRPVSVNPVPEPVTILLLGSGLAALVGFRNKFKKRIVFN